MARIYLSPPDVGEEERTLLLDAFDSNWIAPLGPHVDAFERELAELGGVEHAAALSSGTAALHLALLMLGVGPGDEVLMPTLTFVATANAAVYVGAQPVFLDVDPATWCLDPQLLADELSTRAKKGRLPAAALPVDLYGQCADYDAILEVCARFDVPVIEEAAEAVGARYRDRPAGSFGVMAVYSFNGNKIITTSGGGALLSDRADLIERARYLSTQAREPAVHYEHTVVGFNYRMSNLIAAVGRGQLRRLPSKIEHRRRLKRRYREALSDLPGVGFMPDADYGRPTNWLTVMTIDPTLAAATPTDVRSRLEADDIEARPAWKPMHLQPVYAEAPVTGGGVAEAIFDQGLCLPSGSSLGDDDQDRVIALVREVLESPASPA
jgi:dTDP-4-amino-4,6-dideoxygalactose transaminase